MPVRILCITDPACAWSWASEPGVRMLTTEFGENVAFTFVMAGLAREFEPSAGGGAPGRPGLVHTALEASARSGMPVDPRLWQEAPPRSSYPACMAIKAAVGQGDAAVAALLRTLREGLMAFRRRLDTSEALIEAARDAGLDAGRFRLDLASSATVEAFGADLELAAQLAPDGVLPTFVFEPSGEGARTVVRGLASPPELRAAAIAAGAAPVSDPRPDALEAVTRYGRLATVEVATVCDLPPLKAEADLLELALRWRVRPLAVGGSGRLWEAA